MDRDREETSNTRQTHQPSLRASLVFAVPSALLAAILASSAYTGFKVSARIADLNNSVGRLLDKQVEVVNLHASVSDEGTGSTPTNSPAEVSKQSFDNGSQYEQIEQRLAALTESVAALSSQLSAVPQRPSAYGATATTPPPLPAVLNMGYGAAKEIPPRHAPDGWDSAITDESRLEANEVLRDYAEQARAEIQALQEAGELDRAAMERIKQTTRMQAASELQHRLPTDVYEEMFPEASGGSAM
jgi:hypothetical protein